MSIRQMKIIYGPPGTGKTSTLLRLVEKEIRDVGLTKVAYVTFSKKATLEVQMRLGIKYPFFRTIHAMCFNRTGANVGQMMDREKYVDFGTKAGFALKGYTSTEEGFSGADDDYISAEHLYRNNKEQFQRAFDLIDHRRFTTFLSLYTKYKGTFGFRDFTDLLEQYIAADLAEDVDVAFIDEAQDLTTLQWKVVLKAFRNCKRIYVAGDDDQAIFQWSGSDINAFLKLQGEGEVLSQSYRLPQSIVNKSAKITKLIKKRVPKDYEGLMRDAEFKRNVTLEELDFTNGETWYFLARTNFRLRVYKDYFDDNRVPYNSGATVGEKITVSTIHGVKGGEADNVVLCPDMNQRINKTMWEDPDAEHRVWYTGMTRTKHRLYILAPDNKYSYEYIR